MTSGAPPAGLTACHTGNAIQIADGSIIANGPMQLSRTDTGGMAAIGGGWHISQAQMAERDVNTVGMPRPGYQLTPEQAALFGVPFGTARVS